MHIHAILCQAVCACTRSCAVLQEVHASQVDHLVSRIEALEAQLGLGRASTALSQRSDQMPDVSLAQAAMHRNAEVDMELASAVAVAQADAAADAVALPSPRRTSESRGGWQRSQTGRHHPQSNLQCQAASASSSRWFKGSADRYQRSATAVGSYNNQQVVGRCLESPPQYWQLLTARITDPLMARAS